MHRPAHAAAGRGDRGAEVQAVVGETAAVAAAGDADQTVLGVSAVGAGVVLKQIAVGVVAERGVLPAVATAFVAVGVTLVASAGVAMLVMLLAGW